ncbi:MAG: indoleamine 2,3-dioxygenase [Pseudomonadota bacterium]
MKLADYDIAAERGFLADFEPDRVVLPHVLQPIREAALNLPHWLPSGRIRALLEALPEPDIEAFLVDATDAEARLAMVHYSFLVQSYVWGEPEAPSALPATLARPIWQIAKRIGQQPLLPYSGYVLDNWGRIDDTAGFDLDNVTMLQPFLGGQDEAWFVLIHVAIEARAGALLAEFPALLTAAERHDASALHAALSTMSTVWDDINAIFDRMPERCDPYVYFHRVRPWIHGWKDNPALGAGLVYDGVAETNGEPQSFRGQTGSQSSIVPAVDAVLGLGHADDPLRRYLDELHIYRPPQHRRFIDDVRARSTVREAVSKLGDAAVVERYNENVEKLARFRSRHLEYAATYINKQQRDHEGNAVDIGTGGTPFMKYLKKHRNETQAQLLRDRLAV